jgi:hypothetical protein
MRTTAGQQFRSTAIGLCAARIFMHGGSLDGQRIKISMAVSAEA